MTSDDEFSDILLDDKNNYSTITEQPNLQSIESLILDYNKNKRIEQYINKINFLISKQYNELFSVNLTIFNNKYYYSYSYNLEYLNSDYVKTYCELICNFISKYFVCKCFEKYFYLRILLEDMDDVFKLLKETYSNILEIQLNTTTQNTKYITIKSKL